jgi:hypothetical protein
MIRKQISYLSLLLMVSLGTGSLFAQQVNPAVKTYNTWRDKKVSAEMATEGKFIGMAFAVTKEGEQQAKIDIVVGVGQHVGGLGKVSFVVQPMLTRQIEGKTGFENSGNAATLNFPEIENDKSSENGVIAEPHITINLPAGATAVKITVDDGTGGSSVMLPILDKTSTAILGGTVETETQSLLKCLWYSGDCGGGCGGATFCIGCRTSPNLNCVNCEISCTNGGACTPGTPKPFYCTGQ